MRKRFKDDRSSTSSQACHMHSARSARRGSLRSNGNPNPNDIRSSISSSTVIARNCTSPHSNGLASSRATPYITNLDLSTPTPRPWRP